MGLGGILGILDLEILEFLQKDVKILRFENYCIFENKTAKCLITAKETKNNKMHKIKIYSLELSAN